MTTNAIVTGGAGFIGSHVVDALLRTAIRSPSSTTSPAVIARASPTRPSCA